MKLAWRNLSHDRLRFLVTVAGIAFATFLMVFQGSLLYGFVRAATSIIEASDADIWVTARGVACFDYAAPIPSRFRDLAMGVEGVSQVKRVVTVFTLWQRPSGDRQVVLVIGADAGIGEKFPLPLLREGDTATVPDAVLVDES